jgi:hypothetical protein
MTDNQETSDTTRLDMLVGEKVVSARKEGSDSRETGRVKCWRVSRDSAAFMQVTDSYAMMASGTSNAVVVDSDGTTIRGNLSMLNLGPGVRRAALWVQQIEFMDMIPKTILTLIPSVVPYPPYGMMARTAIGVAMAMGTFLG